MSGKKHLLHSLHHFLTGAVLITKGITKIAHHAFIGSMILLFGVVILSYFIYTLVKKQHGQNLERIVLWFEAVVALFMAYIFYMEGKALIQYVFLLAAIGFFISIYVFSRKEGLMRKSIK